MLSKPSQNCFKTRGETLKYFSNLIKISNDPLNKKYLKIDIFSPSMVISLKSKSATNFMQIVNNIFSKINFIFYDVYLCAIVAEMKTNKYFNKE